MRRAIFPALREALRQRFAPPQAAICSYCGCVVDDIEVHDCSDEPPAECLRHMAGAEDPRYKRAKSYVVE